MVFISCSTDESCNMPMAEANECGIPAVAFDIGGHSEYIQYGILLKTGKCEAERLGIAIEWMHHYHLCTRLLKINCIVPAISDSKFYDFNFQAEICK